MTRKYRISSPKVFETILTESKLFPKHDWIFDIHSGIVTAFRPDIRIAFESNAAPLNSQFGQAATINRQLAVHPNFDFGREENPLAKLEAQTYVTMTHDDDTSLFVAAPNGRELGLRPSRVFRANDVRAAELAVKLKIGYSALPEFILNSDVSRDEAYTSSFTGWKISPTYLRISSPGPANRHLSEIHGALLTALTPLTKTPWHAFGQTQNIIPLVGSK